jgi:hypothetical protein
MSKKSTVTERDRTVQIGDNDEHPAFLTVMERAHRNHQRPLPTIRQYEQMRKAIAEVQRVDEAKDIHDKAEALRAYARIRHDLDLEIMMAQIKLRAVRRIGEISLTLDKSKGGRGKTLASAGKRLKKDELAKAGISISAAHRAEQIAVIPIQEFDDYLEERREDSRPATIREMLISVAQRHKVDRRATGMEEFWSDALPLANPGSLRPGALLRIFKLATARLRTDSEKFQLILALLTELTGHQLIGNWHRQLLARLIDIDAVERTLWRLSQLPPGDGQEAFLKRLHRGEDELYLAIHPRDDLQPLVPKKPPRRTSRATKPPSAARLHDPRQRHAHRRGATR